MEILRRKRERERGGVGGERGLVGSHNRAEFRANSAKIRALYLFWEGATSYFVTEFGHTFPPSKEAKTIYAYGLEIFLPGPNFLSALYHY